MGLLDGKTALVIGASRGIDRGVAIGLARQGARVAVTARTMTPGDAPALGNDGRRVPGSLAETLEAIGEDAIALPADLENADSVRTLVAETVSRLGRLDILANCAMGFPANYEGMEFWKSPVGDWDAQNAVGVRSHYLASYFAAPQMVAQGSGLIVNIRRRARSVNTTISASEPPMAPTRAWPRPWPSTLRGTASRPSRSGRDGC